MRLTFAALASLLVAAPMVAQDYRFTKNLAIGDRLEVSNINGNIEVSQAAGRTAEVTVTKTVKKGDGSLVKAIMEESGSGLRVCTIYLDRESDRRTCNGDSGNNRHHDRDNAVVDMHYVVRVPAGARLDVDDVNGNVTVTGGDAGSHVATVNGDVRFEGVGAASLESVNGKVIGTFSRATWEGSMSVQTVNGSLELTFPSDLSADISGETVNGGVTSDFPITIEKGWGPKSFNGRIGAGGRKLKLETVNGSIMLKKR